MKVFESKDQKDLLLAILELFRRRINKVDTSMALPIFNLLNIDFETLLRLYFEQFPTEIQEIYEGLSDKEKSHIAIPQHTLRIHSKVVRDHPKFSRHNQLHTLLVNGIIDKEDYDSSINDLNDSISCDIKNAFMKGVLCTKQAHSKLTMHVDTLFAVCIFFYNQVWDSDGTSYNGAISFDNSISNLDVQQQPHYYRAHEQAKAISRLLLDYLGGNSASKEVTIRNHKMHTMTDPILTDWIIGLIVDSVRNGSTPISLDYFSGILSNIMKAKDTISNQDLLKELQVISNMNSPDFRDAKRKALKEFCLAIHPIFSYYLDLPIDRFNGQRAKIYHNILKAFYMDDFNDLLRDSQTHIDGELLSNRDEAVNRLGELLRRKD